MHLIHAWAKLLVMQARNFYAEFLIFATRGAGVS